MKVKSFCSTCDKKTDTNVVFCYDNMSGYRYVDFGQCTVCNNKIVLPKLRRDIFAHREIEKENETERTTEYNC